MLARQKRTGTRIAALDRRPVLKATDREYLDVFYTLNASRGLGATRPANIPLSEMLVYAEKALGIDSCYERLKYVEVLQRLDLAYMANWDKKNNKPKS